MAKGWAFNKPSPSTPKGLRRPAQGCRPRLPREELPGVPQPCRGCVRRLELLDPSANPSGLETITGLTQDSRGRQPWAGRRNPFGVGTLADFTQGQLRTAVVG